MNNNCNKQTPNSEIRARVSLISKDVESAELVANKLKEFGFEVRSVSKWGIGIVSEKAIYEKVFQTKVSAKDEVIGFDSDIVLPDGIEDKVRSVYFPTKTTTF